MLNLNHPHGFVTAGGNKARYLGEFEGFFGPQLSFAVAMTWGGNKNYETVWATDLNGKTLSSPSSFDVAEAPAPMVKRTFWMNVYDDYNAGMQYRTEAEANSGAVKGRTACVSVTVDVPAT